MPDPPTGTVTFLFTDIEGSTKRWEQYPQQMQSALQRHDELLRSAIEAEGGYVFKTMGDAFCAAFSSPYDALSAALSAQRALSKEMWDAAIGQVSVRMALHIGAAEERGGDYFGQPLNRVARLLSAGHGGQVLLSDPTRDLVRDNLPLGVTLTDLGEHRLKDLQRPERIFQLVVLGLPSDFPPLKTLDNRPNNLPVLPTPFIGREKEVEAVGALLHNPDVHLVTLTGPGGTGKTRLGLQVAAEMLDSFKDGVWFVELAALTDYKLVASTIAQVLGVTEVPGKPLIESVAQHLKETEKQILLLLDNFEQVVDAAPQVGQLLSSSQGVKVLVSSRLKLNVYGEHEYSVPALSLPDIRQGHLPTLERLTQYEAVRLFIERGQAAKADFQVTNENAPAVAEICVRLDGLPLAIELAAARVKMLSPQALLTRLSSRLKLLTGGARDLSVRQQTLRGAIDWSYDLLDEGEKQLFRRMSVFQGGRSLGAVEEVCNYDGELQIDVFEGVQSLLDKSLIQQREGSDGEPRFWLLETIHEYAREKLQETAVYGGSGEGAPVLREHALYFMRLAEEAEPHLTGKRQQEWLDRLSDDYDNIRAALAWSAEQTNRVEAAGEEGEGEGEEVGLRIGGAIGRFWFVRGLFTEGREHLGALLATSPASSTSPTSPIPTLYSASGKAEGSEGGKQQHLLSRSRSRSTSRAKALNGAGVLARRQGDYSSARALIEESLALMREIGDKQGIAFSLNSLGLVAHEQGDYSSARALHEESLALMRELGDKWGIAHCLNNLGSVAMEQGDYSSARGLYEESLALRREIGDKQGIAHSLNNLGLVAMEQGDYSSARALIEESVARGREMGDKWGIAHSLNNLGTVAMEQGDYTAARALHEESLALRREMGDKMGISYSLNSLGLVAAEQGDYTGARALHSKSLALRMDLGDKKGIAASLAGLGGVAVRVGEAERGTKLLGAVEMLLQSISAVLYREDRLPYEKNAQRARALLGEEEFERAWQEGRAMSMEQAIEYALEER